MVKPHDAPDVLLVAIGYATSATAGAAFTAARQLDDAGHPDGSHLRRLQRAASGCRDERAGFRGGRRGIALTCSRTPLPVRVIVSHAEPEPTLGIAASIPGLSRPVRWATRRARWN